MASRGDPLRVDERRKLTQIDFGGGNAWRAALDASVTPRRPTVFTDRPIPDELGAMRSQFSVADLNKLATAWSSWYHAARVRPGDRVAVHITDSFENQIHLTALAQIGAVPVLIDGTLPPEHAIALMERSAPVGIYTDIAHFSMLSDAIRRVPSVTWFHTRESVGPITAPPLPGSALYRHHDDDPVALCHGPGDTGVPELVVWTHRRSVAGARLLLADRRELPDSSVLSAVPQSHPCAMVFTFYALLAGVTLISISNRSADGVIRAARNFRPTTIHALPGLHAAVATADPDPGDLTSVREWMNAGDPVPRAHVRTLGHSAVDSPTPI